MSRKQPYPPPPQNPIDRLKPPPPPHRLTKGGNFNGNPAPKAPPDWDGYTASPTEGGIAVFTWTTYILIALMGGVFGCVVKDYIAGFWRGLTG